MKVTRLHFVWLIAPLLAVGAGCYESPNRYEAVNNGQGGVNLVRVPKTADEIDDSPAPATSQPTSEVQQLQAEVKELQAENAQLRRNATTSP